MADKKAKILMLVEGEKTDVKLMEHLLAIYGIGNSHQIISYNTNIYTLYNSMFRDVNPDEMDLLQVLKEHERDIEKKKIFDENYSDILLIFDLDPQDSSFSASKIMQMTEYFKESNDVGKLYLNYPMVEAFYHMKSIPDDDYDYYKASLDELMSRKYKERVNRENRNHDYSKFAVDKNECATVIKQNIFKAQLIANAGKCKYSEKYDIPESKDILTAQLSMIQNYNELFVLCTCAFYIVDYNSDFIKQHK